MLTPDLLAVGVVCSLTLAIVVMVRPIWGLFLVLVANQVEFFVPLGEGLSVGRIVGLVVAMGWFANLSLRRRTKVSLHKKINAPMFLFVVVATIGVAGAVDLQGGSIQLLKLGMLVFLAVLVEDLITNRRDLRNLVWVIAMSYGLSSVVGIMQFREIRAGKQAIGDVVGGDGALRFAGLHDNPNAFGIMLMSGIPFLVLLILESRRWSLRALYSAIFAMSVFSLLLTVSRTHMLAFLVFMSVYIVTEYRSWVLSTRGIVVLVLLITILIGAFSVAPDYVFERFSRLTPASDDSAAYRYLLLKKAFVLGWTHPLFGVGLRNFSLHEPYPGMDAHDTFGVVLGETGITGFGVFALLVAFVVIVQRKNISRFRRAGDPSLTRLATVVHSAFVMYLAISFGNIIVFQRMFWVYIALTAVLSQPMAYRLLAQRVVPHFRKVSLLSVRPAVQRLKSSQS